jgi:hypothetical protein
MTDEVDAEFAVSVAETSAPVEAGETLTVTVMIENASDGDAVGEVSLQRGNEAVDTSEVELEAGVSESVDLAWDTSPGDVGEHELVVATPLERVSRAVTVEQAPATFDVEITRVPEHVTPGVAVAIEVIVENTGTLEGTQDIEFSIDDTVEHTEQGLTLAGQESETIIYTHETTGDVRTEIPITVASEDDETSDTVPIVTQSVSSWRELGNKGGMGPLGWVVLLGMVILLIPLLPFVILIKLIDILTGDGQPAR